MVRLLISVCSVAEAEASIHNGADIIDVEGPSPGSTGMASPEVIRAVTREVPPRFPVSATLGEWLSWRREGGFPSIPAGLGYLRIGLAGTARHESWREELGRFRRELAIRSEIYGEPEWMAVAYADWREAESPTPPEVLDFAAAGGFPIFLLDTWRKDGSSLLDHQSAGELERLAGAVHARGLELALAGALKLSDIETVRDLAPDIIGIRSAACPGGLRSGRIDPVAVRDIAASVS